MSDHVNSEDQDSPSKRGDRGGSDSSENRAGHAEWMEQARLQADRKRVERHPPRQHSEDVDKRNRVARPVGESDEELFLKYQHGDQAAFLKLYDRYKSSIFAYCAQVLMGAGLDRGLAEDTFQEVFLRLTQYQHTFTGGEFKAWIFTVARHSCLSAKKRGLRHKVNTEYVGDAENFEEDVSAEARQALQHTDDALERMSKQEQIDLLLKAIALLPETYREALILSEYEGMTYDEIGKLTGTSLSTIRIRIFRAKARLRKMLLPIIGDEVDGLVPPIDPTEE